MRIVENDAQILPGLYGLHNFFIFFHLIPSSGSSAGKGTGYTPGAEMSHGPFRYHIAHQKILYKFQLHFSALKRIVIFLFQGIWKTPSPTSKS